MDSYMQGNVNVNPWLNAFDWSKRNAVGFSPISLSPNVSWLIQDFTGNAYRMSSPYQSGGAPGAYYLNEPITNFKASDFHWEDGWELLWLGTGYYPNGEDVTSENPQRIYPSRRGVSNPRAPYFILYNRYRGLMRVFVNVFDLPTGKSNAFIDLYHLGRNGKSRNFSGVLRLVNGIDRPLDLPTASIFMRTNQSSTLQYSRWMTADFQMAYDPCVCEYPNMLMLGVSVWDSLDINLIGTGRELKVPIKDYARNSGHYDLNFLSVHALEQNTQSFGYLVYHKMNELVTDYQKRLRAIDQNLNDYSRQRNAATSTGLDGLNDYLTKGEVNYSFWASTFALIGDDLGLTQAQSTYKYLEDGNSLREFPSELGNIGNGPFKDGWQISDSNYIVDVRLDGDTVTMRRYDFASIERDLESNAAKLLGGDFDMLSLQFFPKGANEPLRPSTHAASSTGLLFNGNVMDTKKVADIGPFYTPGSHKRGWDFSPFSYPAYDEAMGVFALLETPKFKVYQAEAEWEWKGRFQNWEGGPMPGADYEEWRINKELLLKLDAPLKYQLNQALDIDYENTELLVMLELEYRSLEDYDPAFDPNAQGFFNNPALDFYESVGGNLKQFHGFKTNVASYHPNFAANEKVFNTKWYPIEDFGELLMALKIRTGYRNTNPQQNYPPSYMLAELLENRLVKARLKVLVDVGFDQVSYSGEKVRNTQVFTYNLFDESQGIDYLNYIEDEAVNDLVKYRPGKLVLKDELLNSSSKRVFATVADELQVKAEDIEVYGNITVPQGMTLVLEAKDEVKVHPQASLPINTIMRINGSPYQFPKIMEQTNAQVRSFCQDQQNGYRANFLVAKQSGVSFQDTSAEASANEFKVYPNPSSGIVQVKFGIASNWIRVSVHDLKGRLYLEEVLGEEFTKAFEVDLEDMKPGVYLLQIQNADGEFYSEKILKY
ncbi:MAG: T9SS type A sorting domain-containing protein [Bacteroidetes bacterium]|nr:T9SS type A sorting domain-containing protein [Bacteroidota bacterium]